MLLPVAPMRSWHQVILAPVGLYLTPIEIFVLTLITSQTIHVVCGRT